MSADVQAELITAAPNTVLEIRLKDMRYSTYIGCVKSMWKKQEEQTIY